MEAIRVKFVVAISEDNVSEDNVSEAFEGFVDQITPERIRFMIPVSVMEEIHLDQNSPASMPARILMLIYLRRTDPPIQFVGSISHWEPSSRNDEQGYGVMVEIEEITPEDCRRIGDYLEDVESQPKDRRHETRRSTDRFLVRVQQMLETLVDMSHGKHKEFGEEFADLISLKDILGRRSDDRRLGNRICASIEQLGSYIVRTSADRAGLRKVQLRKVKGKQEASMKKARTFVGWGQARPQVGKRYFVYLESGGVFRSAIVRQVSENHFQTKNSLYEIRLLTE